MDINQYIEEVSKTNSVEFQTIDEFYKEFKEVLDAE
jgi:hypothetical protein